MREIIYGHARRSSSSLPPGGPSARVVPKALAPRVPAPDAPLDFSHDDACRRRVNFRRRWRICCALRILRILRMRLKDLHRPALRKKRARKRKEKRNEMRGRGGRDYEMLGDGNTCSRELASRRAGEPQRSRVISL